MNTKASIATENAPTAWQQVKLTFIVYLGVSIILWLKVIITLMSFMQTMQKVVASNIRDETMGHVPCTCNN
jgi:hypothetical protein